MHRRYQYIILAIIPLIYTWICFHFNLLIGTYSLRNMDPEYIYFISGLGISNGHLHLGHFDNPGTPLQMLIAATYRIFYVFRPGDNTFLEDVFIHSDHYLNMANHVTTLLVSVVLFIGGIQALKITGNIAYALMLQTAPFYSEITYDIAGRLIPELLMPIPVVIFTLIFLKHIYEKEEVTPFNKLVFLALTAGFGLSIKMTFLPFWVVPLFIIIGWKKRLIYMGLSVLAFLLIAMPVTLEIDIFYRWMRDLFIHSGTYGSGSANFIDPESFMQNLTQLWRSTTTLFYLLLILAGAMILHLFLAKKETSDKRLVLLTAGLLLAILLQLFISTKHYAYRYIIPTLAFMPLAGILTFELLNRLRPSRFNKYLIIAITMLAFIPGTKKQIVSAQIRTKGIGEEMARKRKTWHHAQALPDDIIKIIVSQAYGAPFQDYVIAYSTAWAGPRMKDYREVLARLYPDSYMYNTWDDNIKAFGEPFDAQKIAMEGKPVVLYLEHDTSELFERTMNKFFHPDDPVVVTHEPIYHNPETNEGLYWLFLTPLTDPEP